MTEPGARQPALDGIRAVAVLAVLLFHGGVGWLPGGFLGVDAFFVLSGYLITALLVSEWERRQRIDLVAFWARRMRRLLPALFAMVTTVVVVAGLRADAAVAASLRGDALAALGYVANWRFAATQGDYFAESAAPPPLQHTWSLGVEEQFYLLWPLLLLLFLHGARRPRVRVGVVAAVGAVASAVLMALLFAPGVGQTRVYYGSDTRAQSVLVGAALAAALAGRGAASGSARTLAALTGVAGMAVLAACCVGFDSGSPVLYRGGFLIAAVGAAALIAGVVLAPTTPPARMLGVGPMRRLGRISYGVYLWHWPVQLAVTADRTTLAGTSLLLVRLAVTVLLAAASWWLVEQPVRRRARTAVRAVPAWLGAGAVVAALVVAVTTVTVPPPAVAVVASDMPVAAGPTEAEAAAAGGAVVAASALPLPTQTAARAAAPAPVRPRPLRVSFFGDSVAESLALGLSPVAAAYGMSVADDAVMGCGITVAPAFRLRGQVRTAADACSGWPALWARAAARDAPDVAVVLVGRHEIWDALVAGRWTHVGDPSYNAYLRDRLRQAIGIAGAGGARVVLLTAPYFRQPEAPDGGVWPENRTERVDAWNALLRSVAGAAVPVVDVGSVAGDPRLRSDGVHFSASGARAVAPWLLPVLRAAAGR